MTVRYLDFPSNLTPADVLPLSILRTNHNGCPHPYPLLMAFFLGEVPSTYPGMGSN